MKHRFTKLNKVLSWKHVQILTLLAALFALSSPVQGQYCQAQHSVGCGWSSNQYYAAIEEVQFEANGKSLWRKSADGCAGYVPGYRAGTHNHVITSTPTFTLSYGGDFTVKVNGSGRYQYSMFVGIWIDLNRDNDFDDAGEFLGNHNFTEGLAGGTLPALTEIKLTVPCGASGTGASRIRIRSGSRFSQAFRANQSCIVRNYGESEDFSVTLKNPTTLAAGFFIPDTAFVRTPISLVNNNQSGYVGHEWDEGDDGTIEGTGVNHTVNYATAGKYCVRLKSENCLGRDSVIDCVEIVKPVGPPVADFASDKNVVELNSGFKLIDLSQNGAYKWDWFIFKANDSAATRIDGDNQFFWPLKGSDPALHKNPEILTAKGIAGFPDVGLWSVGLIAENDNGASVEVVKKDYVEVMRGCDSEMGPGTLTAIPGNVITCASGTIVDKDDQGNPGNYSTGEQNLDALIAPCGATEITMVFKQWKVKSNMLLRVYDGQDAGGTPLHTGSGFNDVNIPGTLVAKSGAIYFIYDTPGAGTDSGFLAEWTSKIGTISAPVASFTNPGTVTKAVSNSFFNTSANATGEVFYSWEVDGVIEATSKDFMDKTWYSTTAGAGHQVCLTVETCAGKNKHCEYVKVEDPTGPTDLDFVTDNRRPRAGDEIVFTTTADKANTFLWTFFPGSSVTYVNGTSASSKNPEVSFSAPGKYTVSLKAWNNWTPADSTTSYNQVIKNKYIIVINYCTPILGLQTSSDISINHVKLMDSDSKILIDETTGNDEYTDHGANGVEPATLTYGSTYDIMVSRLTAANPMSRKVWIDYNIDGDFDDAGEMVLTDGPNQNTSVTGSILIPDLANAFEGPTKMRIGVSYGTDPNVPCGASSGINNANRIGEFEDFAIVLSNDYTIPELTLIGGDTVYVELNTTYTDAGAKAIDFTEGDISWRMDTTSDVDIAAAGIYYVTYSVSDASGNPAMPVTRVVYVVVDQTPPVLTLLPDNNPVYIEVLKESYSESSYGYTAMDANDGDLKTAVLVTGNVNTFKIGTYVLNYSVQDAQGNKSTASRTVIVRDTEFPTLVNGDIKVISGRNVVEVELQAVFVDITQSGDNYNDGVLASRYTLDITPATATGEANVDTRVRGTTVVTYTATDESGNKTVLVIDYVVEDYTAPIIDLNTFSSVDHSVNSAYTPVEPSVSDNFYDNTQVSLTRSSNVNPFKIGAYQDSYTATDASGNSSTAIRTVNVVDRIKPVISGKNGPILKVGLWSSFKAQDYIVLKDNYENSAVLKSNLKMLSNNINTYVKGFYAVVFQTEDGSGNVSAPYTFLIEVNDKYRTITGVNDINIDNLFKVYPNPSNGVFNVSVALPSNEQVDISIYDIVGTKVESVINGDLKAGTYTMNMNNASSGVYFVKMSVNGAVYTKRIVLK